MLSRGEALGVVLASVLGCCSQGRASLVVWLRALANVPTLHSRRMLLEHWLRTFEGAERHGSQWRVIGPAAYVGRAHELAPKMVEVLDPESGELRLEPTAELTRVHCPAALAGGLAVRQHRSPRQLHRYRATLRAHRLMASRQPPYDASDAVRPRGPDGSWAYAQHWLTMPPTPEMIRRWRGRTAPPRHALPDCGPDAPATRADDVTRLRELVDGPRDARNT